MTACEQIRRKLPAFRYLAFKHPEKYILTRYRSEKTYEIGLRYVTSSGHAMYDSIILKYNDASSNKICWKFPVTEELKESIRSIRGEL